MFITPTFKRSLIVEQFQGNYLKHERKNISQSANTNAYVNDVLTEHRHEQQQQQQQHWLYFYNSEKAFVARS